MKTFLIIFIGLIFIAGCSRPHDLEPKSLMVAPPKAEVKEAPHPTDALWVTFAVNKDANKEQFHIVITNANTIATVLNFVSGREIPHIPIGTVLKGGDFNSPWSWHLDPASIQFADFTTEVCDGIPSYLESHLTEWINSTKRYCPWNAEIIEVQDCRSNSCIPLEQHWSAG